MSGFSVSAAVTLKLARASVAASPTIKALRRTAQKYACVKRSLVKNLMFMFQTIIAQIASLR